MAKKKKEGGIRCLAHRTYLRSGSTKASVQGIRVDIRGNQKTELKDLAESIGYANSATPADVLAVWSAMEREIIRALEDGRRVSLGSLGTLRLEIGTKPGKSTAKSITGKDIEAKGITFTPSKEVNQRLKELTFECDGIVGHELSPPAHRGGTGRAFCHAPVHQRTKLCHPMPLQREHGTPPHRTDAERGEAGAERSGERTL